MQSEYDGTDECKVNTMERRNEKWIGWNKKMQSEYDVTEKCKVNTTVQQINIILYNITF